MDFVIENYVWFTIIGVFLVMALIGFIAEKTDFGRKGREAKPKIEKEVLKEVAIPVVEVVNEPLLKEETKKTMPTFDELLVKPVVEEKVEVPAVNIDMVEEILEPVVNEEVIVSEEPMIEEIVASPLNEEPIVDLEEINPMILDSEPIEEILPDLNNIKDEEAVVEENIWKI